MSKSCGVAPGRLLLSWPLDRAQRRPGLPERAAAASWCLQAGRFHGYGGAHAGAEAQGPFQSPVVVETAPARTAR